MKYRSEIDGLRALAVVPVVLFHAGFSLFSGGFVGVDIFFVISGYLITSILLSDIENDRFSLLDFYERRARRILPALFVVVFACIPVAWMWMLPNQMKDFSESLLAVSVFASNILFWSESGYFDAVAEQKPLLHTWSLAVEEQYYIFFPVLLLLLWRFGKSRVFIAIVVLALMSLALSEWGWRHDAAANFYLAPTRAWELFAGSVAAFIMQKRCIEGNNSLSLLGLGLIFVSVFAFDESIPFPSLYTLVPVVGAVFLVLFATKDTFVAKVLSAKAVVGMGLISYSVYLWHQPLFAFARLRHVKEPSFILMGALVLMAIGLGVLSWKFIEQPFRRRADVGFGRKSIFTMSGVGILLLSSLGYVGHHQNGYLNSPLQRAPNTVYSSLAEKISVLGDVCNPKFVSSTSHIQRCDFGDLNAVDAIVLIGDSHAQAISYSLNDTLIERNTRGIFLALDGCETVPYIHRDKRGLKNQCDVRFQAFSKYLAGLNSDVILISRWSHKLFPIDDFIEAMPYENSDGYVEQDVTYREYAAMRDGSLSQSGVDKEWALRTYLEYMASSARTLYLVYPVPETGVDIEKYNRLHYESTGEVAESLSMSVEDYDKRNEFVINVFNQVSLETENLIEIKPKEIFCNSYIPGRCAIQHKSVPLYYDDDHLSKSGSDLIVAHIEGLRTWN